MTIYLLVIRIKQRPIWLILFASMYLFVSASASLAQKDKSVDIGQPDNKPVQTSDAEVVNDKKLTFKNDSAVVPAKSAATYAISVTVLVLLIVLLVFVRHRLLNKVGAIAKGHLEVIDRKRIGVNTWTSLVRAHSSEFLIVENNHGVAIQRIPSDGFSNQESL